RPDRDRVIPPVPEVAGAELPRLPAQVPLLGVAHPVCPVAEELGVPLGRTELPRHLRTAPLALALVPPAVHCPIPGEGHPVLAEEHRLDALARPVLEPI